MRRQSSRSRVRTYRSVLHARLWTTRMIWLGSAKVFIALMKVACVLGILGGIGWGIKLGIQRAFYDNPDFKLQAVELNPNQAIDEVDFVRITGIDLSSNLFKLDVKAITAALAGLPGVADVFVERRLPGTLVVRVTARMPQAWIACPGAGLTPGRKVGAMLVDTRDVIYPCSVRQFDDALKLPVIELPGNDKSAMAVGRKIVAPELQRCLRLVTTIREHDPDSLQWLDSIKQANAWSLALTTRGGTVATFGLSDHVRQLANLRAALTHAKKQGYTIATINLIPKQNVPVTVTTPAHVPVAIPVADDPSPPPKAIRVTDAPPKAIRVTDAPPKAIRPDRKSHDPKPPVKRE